MPWRPIFLLSSLVLAFIGNGAMLYYEQIDGAEVEEGLTDDVRTVSYIFMPHKRRDNFKNMGLGRLAAPAAAEADRLAKSEKRILAVMQESADDLRPVTCTGNRVPPRFALLPLVVEQDDNGRRRVIDGARATEFFQQEWAEFSRYDEVYSKLELRANRSDAAPAVGVAGVLANAEEAAENEEGPFDAGFTGLDIEDVIAEYPWVENELVRYFALMHVLTELARSEKGGICG
jgi:hypothetical protein